MTVCCSLWDTPCGVHSSGDVGELLRETGKKLRLDVEKSEVKSSLETILKIFSSDFAPLCPPKLSLKRTCLLMIQLMQIVALEGEELIVAVGVELGVNLGRLDAKILRFFLREALDVVRILRDLVGGGSVEVFQQFRSVLTNSGDSGRGVVITVDKDSSFTGGRNLLKIASEIDKKFNFFFLADQQDKLDSIRRSCTEPTPSPKCDFLDSSSCENILDVIASVERKTGKKSPNFSFQNLIDEIFAPEPRGVLSLMQHQLGSVPRDCVLFPRIVCNLGKEIGRQIFQKKSVPDELFVAHLDYSMFLILLEKGLHRSDAIKFVSSAIVSDFDLVEFVEASFSSVMVALIAEVTEIISANEVSESCFLEGLKCCEQVLHIVDQIVGTSRSVPTTKKAKKSTNSFKTSILESNFLEIIQSVHDSVGLTLLIAMGGEHIVDAFAAPILELMLKILKKNEVFKHRLISTFLSVLTRPQSALPGLLEFMSKEMRIHWLEQAPRGLRELWSNQGTSSVAEYCVETLKSENFSKSVKIAVLKKLDNISFSQSSGELVLALAEFARSSLLDSPTDLVICAKILGRIGPFSPQTEQRSLTRETNFARDLITQFLVPNLRSSAHAFALQELLSTMGAVEVPLETEVIIRPYYTSSYRQVGQWAGSVDSLSSLLGWISAWIEDDKYRIVFKSLHLAASENPGLAAWLIPFAVEKVVTKDEFRAEISEIFSSFFRSSSDRLVITTLFAVMDQVKSIVVETGLLVRGAIQVEDWPRALFWQEKCQKDPNFVLNLCAIYKGLEDFNGVAGALSLDESLLVEKFAIRGKYFDWIKICEKLSLEKRLQALCEAGEYRAVVDACRGSANVEAKYRAVIDAATNVKDESILPWFWEAAWKGGFVFGGEKISTPKTFNEAMYRLISCRDEQVVLDQILADIMRQAGMNLTWSAISKLFLLTHIGNPEFEELALNTNTECRAEILTAAIGLARANASHPDQNKCRAISNDANNAHSDHNKCLVIANDANNAHSDNPEKLTLALVRHYRKMNDLPKLRQLLLGQDGRSSIEWLKAMWCVDETNREEVRIKLEKLEPQTFESKLLLLRWSAELERLIPRVTISKYRDLMQSAISNEVHREKAAFHFADFLDSKIVPGPVWDGKILAREIAVNFFESIKFDVSGKRTLYTVNRLLELHYEDSLGHYAAEIVKVLAAGWKQVPVWVWAQALPQLIPRLTGESPDFAGLMEKIVSTVLCTYPRQAGWSFIQLLTSRNLERKKIGTRIFNSVAAKAEYPNMGQLLTLIKTVGDSFVFVARMDGDNLKQLSQSKEGSRLLRDTGGLLVMPVNSQLNNFKNTEEIRIAKFLDPIYVYNTKAKPKRISVVDTSGKNFSFILKVEKKTDLRKDARMMQFVSLINHEIVKTTQFGKSLAPLRTYSVVPLSEDCALIEFIPNLVTLRKIIDEGLTKTGKNVNMYLNKEVMNKLSKEGYPYFLSIVEKVPPMLADWFVTQFRNPQLWLRARNNFTTSQAMWSMVGHLVGLGDRHPDNILIDQETGELVHVDFDCIFSRGMLLTIPELVPFRLTKICVSAMGVTGVEGQFRISCETLMRLLRKKKKTLLTVLHAFIADPLIDWSSSKKAKEVVGAIEKKLNGFVDVGEMRLEIAQNERLINYNEDTKGLGKDRGAALGVEGQVDELIRAAVCQHNLAKMYLGWMPLF